MNTSQGEYETELFSEWTARQGEAQICFLKWPGALQAGFDPGVEAGKEFVLVIDGRRSALIKASDFEKQRSGLSRVGTFLIDLLLCVRSEWKPAELS